MNATEELPNGTLVTTHINAVGLGEDLVTLDDFEETVVQASV